MFPGMLAEEDRENGKIVNEFADDNAP